jgi:hypothetical protein
MKTEQKNQKLEVKYLSPTNTKGTRYSVKGLGGRKILAFDYSARYPEQAAALEYLSLTTNKKDWSLMEVAETKDKTYFFAYSVWPVNITNHKPILEDYSWTR